VSLFQAFARFKQTFIEQRRSIREYVDFPAWIDVGDGSQPRKCTVVDVSEDGARVMAAFPAKLPKEFWLLLSKDRTRRRRCRMVWRSDTQVGIQYLGDIESDFFPPKVNS
jgi:PilZ domain